MSIASQRSVSRADDRRVDRGVAASTSDRKGSVVSLPLRAFGGPSEDGLASLLEAIRAVDAEDADVHDEFTDLDDDAAELDDAAEFAAQDLAMAAESADLRSRVAVLVAALETGRDVERDRIDAILCAFRSYEPFLGERDRALNADAERALVTAVRTPPQVLPAA